MEGALEGCLLCFPGFWEILAWLEKGWCVLEEGRIGRWSPRAGAAPPSWMWGALSPSDLGFLLCWDQRPEIPTSPSAACLHPPGLRSPDVPLVAQTVKNLPAMQETRIQSLGWEDPLEEGISTHSSILAWRIPWMEEPGRLQSMGPQRVRHD